MGAATRLAYVAVAALLGSALLIGANVRGAQKASLAPGGPIFLLARLLEDGTALSYMEQTCSAASTAASRICSEVEGLKRYAEIVKNDPALDNMANYFLWDGPLDRLGGFTLENAADASDIVRGALSVSWPNQIAAGLRNSVRQLVTFGVSKRSFPAIVKAVPPLPQIEEQLGAAALTAYRGSLQAKGELGFDWYDRVYTSVVIISCLSLAWMLTRAFRRGDGFNSVNTFVFLIIGGVVANAIVLGSLSGVEDRYQARVIWLLPLSAMLLGAHSFRASRATQHGRLAGPLRNTERT